MPIIGANQSICFLVLLLLLLHQHHTTTTKADWWLCFGGEPQLGQLSVDDWTETIRHLHIHTIPSQLSVNSTTDSFVEKAKR